jgi:hypothetical protein
LESEFLGHCLELCENSLPDEAHGMQIQRPKSSRSVIYNDPAVTNPNILLLSRSNKNNALDEFVPSSRNQDIIFTRFIAVHRSRVSKSKVV